MSDPSPGVTITEESRAATTSWIDQNPLRAWRREQKATILETAGRLGVGMSMVQMYERGVHKPGADRAAAFEKLLGSDWSERWDRWLASRPA